MLTSRERAEDYLKQALQAEAVGDIVAAVCLLQIAAAWELED